MSSRSDRVIDLVFGGAAEISWCLWWDQGCQTRSSGGSNPGIRGDPRSRPDWCPPTASASSSSPAPIWSPRWIQRWSRLRRRGPTGRPSTSSSGSPYDQARAQGGSLAHGDGPASRVRSPRAGAPDPSDGYSALSGADELIEPAGQPAVPGWGSVQTPTLGFPSSSCCRASCSSRPGSAPRTADARATHAPTCTGRSVATRSARCPCRTGY
jgi:hypothetical protein